MTDLTKLLIAAGVTAVGIGVTVVSVKKMKEKKENDIPEDESQAEAGIVKRIKKYVTKKVIKFLAWVALHQQQIEAVVTVLSLGGAVFSVVNAVRDFRTGNKMRDQIDTLLEHQTKFQQAWNGTIDNYDANWNAVMKTQHTEVMDKLNDIHLDMSMMHEIKESLVTPVKKSKAS
jgi:hypothetical protein